MTNITELAQSHELLIANGQQTADLLRHLADNEIDSDYFAVVSECESYGKETDAELSITEFALRAAGYVDALVEALEKAQQRNGELDSQLKAAENNEIDARCHIAELESRKEKHPPAPYAYLRENDGQIQISIGAERPSDRSGGYATPWFAIYTAAGIKVEIK
ncbi:hypothetical protein AAHX24_07115 [Klebsiella pneumoniae]